MGMEIAGENAMYTDRLSETNVRWGTWKSLEVLVVGFRTLKGVGQVPRCPPFVDVNAKESRRPWTNGDSEIPCVLALSPSGGPTQA